MGECTVKHGARVHLYNLLVGEIGNPARPGNIAPSAQTVAAAVA